MASEIPRYQLYILMVLMLLFGATNTIMHKFQNELTTDDPVRGTLKYTHPFFQGWSMMVSELMCLVVYKIYDYRQRKKYGGKDKIPSVIEAKEQGKNLNINVLLLAIPASFDITGSTIQFIALTMIAASIYQMMRGTLVFVIAFFSILFLGRKLFRHHWSSLSVILAGLILVGASPLIYPDPKAEEEEGNEALYVVIGIALIVFSQLFLGMHMITEEKLFQKYHLHPLKVVGWEGLWGVIIYTILLTIFQFIPCSIEKVCPHGTIEDTIQAFREWGRNDWLWISTILYTISIAAFNCLGVSITKYASAAQRSTIDMSRTAVIWIFFLSYQGNGHERFIWTELVGFILLI